MSLKRVAESFPGEVTPSHYAVRIGEPWQHWRDDPEGPWQMYPGEMEEIGRFDNMHDAHRARGRWMAENEFRVPPERIDEATEGLAGVVGRQAGRPYVVTVYPDGSYHEVGSRWGAMDRDHMQDDELRRATDAGRSIGSAHRNFLADLYEAGDFYSHTPGTPPEIARLRAQSWTHHDPSALMAAADALDEARPGRSIQPEIIRSRLAKYYARDGSPTNYGGFAPNVNAFAEPLNKEIDSVHIDVPGIGPEEYGKVFQRLHGHDVLADHLQDYNDPRERIVRGRVQFPFSVGAELAGTTEWAWNLIVPEHQFPDGTALQVHKNTENPSHFVVAWGGEHHRRGDYSSTVPWYNTVMDRNQLTDFLRELPREHRPDLSAEGIDPDAKPKPKPEPVHPMARWLAGLDDGPQQLSRGDAPVAYAEFDEADFLHPIASNPTDKLIAGVYADWLEEHGLIAHAHMVRSHIGLSGNGGEVRKADDLEEITDPDEPSPHTAVTAGPGLGTWAGRKSPGGGPDDYRVFLHKTLPDGRWLRWTDRDRDPGRAAALVRALTAEGGGEPGVAHDHNADVLFRHTRPADHWLFTFEGGPRPEPPPEHYADDQSSAPSYQPVEPDPSPTYDGGRLWDGPSWMAAGVQPGFVPDHGNSDVESWRYSHAAPYSAIDVPAHYDAGTGETPPDGPLAQINGVGDSDTVQDSAAWVTNDRAGSTMYSVPAFVAAINRSPTDMTARGAFADWLEENNHPVHRGFHPFSPDTLAVLREHPGPVWAAPDPDGRVHAGRKYTMAEIRQLTRLSGSHFFDPDTVRFFHTRVHGEPFHGPGGVTFVTSDSYGEGTPRMFSVRTFQPAISIFSPSIGTFEPMAHHSLRAAQAVAARIASGRSVDRRNPDQMQGIFDDDPPSERPPDRTGEHGNPTGYSVGYADDPPAAGPGRGWRGPFERGEPQPPALSNGEVMAGMRARRGAADPAENAARVAHHVAANGPANRRVLVRHLNVPAAALDAALAHGHAAGMFVVETKPAVGGNRGGGRPGTWVRPPDPGPRAAARLDELARAGLRGGTDHTLAEIEQLEGVVGPEEAERIRERAYREVAERKHYDHGTGAVFYGEGDHADVRPLLRQIPHRSWRGEPDADHMPRLAAADLMDELRRHDEANVLRDTSRHAFVDFGGRVQDAHDLSRQCHAGYALPDLFTQDYIDALLAGTLVPRPDGPGSTPASNVYGHLHPSRDEAVISFRPRPNPLTYIHPSTLAAIMADAHHVRALHGNDHSGPGGWDFANSRDSGDPHTGGLMDRWRFVPGAPDSLRDMHHAAMEMGPYRLHLGPDGILRGGYDVGPVPPSERPLDPDRTDEHGNPTGYSAPNVPGNWNMTEYTEYTEYTDPPSFSDFDPPPADDHLVDWQCPHCHQDWEHTPTPADHPARRVTADDGSDPLPGHVPEFGCEECVVPCENCRHTEFSDRTTEVHRPHRRSTDSVCRVCAEDTAPCDDCDSRFYNDDLNEVSTTPRRPGRGSHRMVCGLCRDENYSECPDCSRVLHNDYLTGNNSADEPICERCAEHYFTCENCNNTYHNDDYGSDGQCEACAEDSQDSDPDLIHGYNYDPPGGFDVHTAGPRDDGRHLGVELETVTRSGHDVQENARRVLDGLNRDMDDEGFAYLKEDGSLSGGSGAFEIVTHPATLDVHKERWPPVLVPNAPPGLISHNTECCGLHVHVNREQLTEPQIGKILHFVNCANNVDFVHQLAGRLSPRYAKVDPNKKPSDVLKGATSRYEAVNLTNDATVEFRIFKGTLKPETFFRRLEFVDAVCAFAAPARVSYRDVVGPDKFFEFVAANRRRYPNLFAFCEHFAQRELAPKPRPRPPGYAADGEPTYYDDPWPVVGGEAVAPPAISVSIRMRPRYRARPVSRPGPFPPPHPFPPGGSTPQPGFMPPTGYEAPDSHGSPASPGHGEPMDYAGPDRGVLHSWLAPTGEFHPVGYKHDAWAYGRGTTPDELFAAGWHRVTYVGKELIAENPHQPPNGHQTGALRDAALVHGMDSLVHDNQQRERELWRRSDDGADYAGVGPRTNYGAAPTAYVDALGNYEHADFHPQIFDTRGHDLTPTLSYADWLEESGMHAHSEVVRRHVGYYTREQERDREKGHSGDEWQPGGHTWDRSRYQTDDSDTIGADPAGPDPAGQRAAGPEHFVEAHGGLRTYSVHIGFRPDPTREVVWKANDLSLDDARRLHDGAVAEGAVSTRTPPGFGDDDGQTLELHPTFNARDGGRVDYGHAEAEHFVNALSSPEHARTRGGGPDNVNWDAMDHGEHAEFDWLKRRLRGSSYERPAANPHHFARGVGPTNYTSQADLVGLMEQVRANPYDEQLHGAVADAIEELHPNSPLPVLIRRQFNLGVYATEEPRHNLWREPVENSWDGTFAYCAPLHGPHGFDPDIGPFGLYLAHESPPYQPPSLAPGRTNAGSANARWMVHAVSRLPGSEDTGYTFEFPHDEAHHVPAMFPGAVAHIEPQHSEVWHSVRYPHPLGHAEHEVPNAVFRERESRAFEARMEAQERGDPPTPNARGVGPTRYGADDGPVIARHLAAHHDDHFYHQLFADWVDEHHPGHEALTALIRGHATDPGPVQPPRYFGQHPDGEYFGPLGSEADWSTYHGDTPAFRVHAVHPFADGYPHNVPEGEPHHDYSHVVVVAHPLVGGSYSGWSRDDNIGLQNADPEKRGDDRFAVHVFNKPVGYRFKLPIEHAKQLMASLPNVKVPKRVPVDELDPDPPTPNAAPGSPVNYGTPPPNYRDPQNPPHPRKAVWHSAPFGSPGYWVHFLVPSPGRTPDGEFLWVGSDGQPVHAKDGREFNHVMRANVFTWDGPFTRKWDHELDKSILRPPTDEDRVHMEIMAHPEAAEFHRQILARPCDSLVRGAFADWLDEHGYPEHAHGMRQAAGIVGYDPPTFMEPPHPPAPGPDDVDPNDPKWNRRHTGYVAENTREWRLSGFEFVK